MTFDFSTTIGIIGASLVLVAFILGQLKIWKSEWLRYDIVNLIGSILLVWYGFMINGYPFVVLNSIWALVSFRDVIIDLRKNV